MVARWSYGLVRSAGKVLLDYESSPDVRERIKGIVESYKDTRVTDLHIWCIGPGLYSASMSVVTSYPDSPDKYKTLIPSNLGSVHTTVEVYPCPAR